MSNFPKERIELGYEERSKFGECPVCHAQHGKPCHPEVGIQLGHTVGGDPPKDGCHLGRLQNAPRFKVISYEG